jgi:methionyl-tRNA formyltransferase
MKIALFADQAVGQRIAAYLLENFCDDVAFVVTTSQNEIAELAQRHDVPSLLSNDWESLLSRLRGIDLGILAWWPKLIKSTIINSTLMGFINTHPSLLPFNRGKHYNFWALVEEAPFGVTLHVVDEGTDTGPIIAQQSIPYDWTDTGETLYRKAQTAIVELFQSTYPQLRLAGVHAVAQDLSQGSYHHSSELEPASEVQLDRLYHGRQILNLLRARSFDGHPGCWFDDGGQRYEITIKIRKVTT